MGERARGATFALSCMSGGREGERFEEASGRSQKQVVKAASSKTYPWPWR